MRARSSAAARRPGARHASLSVDLAAFAVEAGQFVVLVQRVASPGPHRWELPGRTVGPDSSFDDEARRALREILRQAPSWIEQVRADTGGERHPMGEPVTTVAYAATLPFQALPPGGKHSWLAVSAPKGLSQRQSQLVRLALRYLRERMDIVPVAFRLLPVAFTLGELQETYEVLLGRRLHKASFRRALRAARLVEPMDEWRREGRGRPAQLFRYAPRRRNVARRTVRFDLLG